MPNVRRPRRRSGEEMFCWQLTMRCLSRFNARLDRWFRSVFCVEDDWRDFFSTDEDSNNAS